MRALKHMELKETLYPHNAAHKQGASPPHPQSSPPSPCPPHLPAALSFCPLKTSEKLVIHSPNKYPHTNMLWFHKSTFSEVTIHVLIAKSNSHFSYLFWPLTRAILSSWASFLFYLPPPGSPATTHQFPSLDLILPPTFINAFLIGGDPMLPGWAISFILLVASQRNYFKIWPLS